MDIKKKLEGVMSADEITAFETGIEKMILEQVETRVKSETVSLKKKYDSVAEEYCKKMIAEGVEKEKEAILKEYDGKLALLESKVNKNLDRFLEEEIIPQVSNEIIGKIAINEALSPIVVGIKKVLEENYIAVDSDGSAILGEAKTEILKLKRELNSTIEEKMQLNERLEKVATYLLINEQTANLKPNSKKRVQDMFKDKPFDQVEGRIKEFCEFLLESEAKPVDEGKRIITEDVAPEATVLPKVPSTDTEDVDSVLDKANRFLAY